MKPKMPSTFRIAWSAPARGLLSCIAFLGLLPAHAADLRSQIDQYRLAHEAAIVGEIDALTRLKSVAADPAGLIATAHWLENALKTRGFEVSELATGPSSAPAVFGYLKTAGARRTVVFYAHYDGQPVTPAQWSSDPFTPVMRANALSPDAHEVDWKKSTPPFDPEWRLFGRAVSDDKASIAAFLAAFDALKATHASPSVNIKVLWEGEEEAGSQHLGHTLRDNQKLLSADLFLIGDGPVHQTRKPMIYFGARGVLSLEATIYGPVRALHDGHYGNWVPNPASMAATLIAQMRNDDGRILIPGFSDNVRAITADELAALRAMPPVGEALKQEYGIGRTEGSEELPASIMRPALNIRGIRSGQVAESAANAIPTTANISIDFRLVPDQTPAGSRAAVEHFLTAHGWTIVSEDPDLATRLAHPRIIKLVWDSGYPALRSDMSSPAAKAVIAAAGKAAGSPVVVLPMSGGSVPLYMFAEVFSAPIICVPIVNHDNSQHAANENLRLQNLWDGIDTYAALMAELNW
jgi:acetylornithine deacetylase/succinyl-diaminopimelate desuccinylase-like protein